MSTRLFSQDNAASSAFLCSDNEVYCSREQPKLSILLHVSCCVGFSADMANMRSRKLVQCGSCLQQASAEEF